MPRRAAAVPRNVFVDGGAWGKFDMAYDDTTTVSDIVLKVVKLIGALYFFPGERDVLAPDGLHLTMWWQRLDSAMRIVELPLRPRRPWLEEQASWARYGGPSEATWLFLNGEAAMDILRQRGYVPKPPRHLTVPWPEQLPPAEPVHVIHLVEGPAHLRLRDPATNELVDIIVVRNPRGYVPQP